MADEDFQVKVAALEPGDAVQAVSNVFQVVRAAVTHQEQVTMVAVPDLTVVLAAASMWIDGHEPSKQELASTRLRKLLVTQQRIKALASRELSGSMRNTAGLKRTLMEIVRLVSPRS